MAADDWDEFPNGRWGDSRSPAYGDLDGYPVSIGINVGFAYRLIVQGILSCVILLIPYTVVDRRIQPLGPSYDIPRHLHSLLQILQG